MRDLTSANHSPYRKCLQAMLSVRYWDALCSTNSNDQQKEGCISLPYQGGKGFPHLPIALAWLEMQEGGSTEESFGKHVLRSLQASQRQGDRTADCRPGDSRMRYASVPGQGTCSVREREYPFRVSRFLRNRRRDGRRPWRGYSLTPLLSRGGVRK